MHPYLVLKIIDDIFQLLALLGLWLKFLLPRVWFLFRINQHPLQISDLEIERRLIMVIEMSGVQFGVKSYAWFQILNHKYDFRPQSPLHEVQLPLYFSHFEIAEFSQYQSFIVQVAGLLKSRNKKAIASHFVFETKMMRYRATMVQFKTEMMRFRTWITRFRTDVIYRKKK